MMMLYAYCIPKNERGQKLFPNFRHLFRQDVEVIVFDILIGLGVPMFAALFPIIGGVRITVREAISNYGIANSKLQIPKRRWIPQFATLAPHASSGVTNSLFNFLSRPLLLPLRNTFRRKARMKLTLLTLIFAGTIFISNMNVRFALANARDRTAILSERYSDQL